MVKRTLKVVAAMLLLSLPAAAHEGLGRDGIRLRGMVAHYFEESGRSAALRCGQDLTEEDFSTAIRKLQSEMGPIWERYRKDFEAWVEQSRPFYERGRTSGQSSCASGRAAKEQATATHSERAALNTAKTYAERIR